VEWDDTAQKDDTVRHDDTATQGGEVAQDDTDSSPLTKGRNRGVALADALAKDYETAPIEPADKAMLDYAAKLTKTPAAVGQGNVDALRKAGFSDGAILDICQVTAYFAFVNRIADGLGVELEGE